MDDLLCCRKCKEPYDTDLRLLKKSLHRLPVSCRSCPFSICYRCFRYEVDEWRTQIEDDDRILITKSIKCVHCGCVDGFDAKDPNFCPFACRLIEEAKKAAASSGLASKPPATVTPLKRPAVAQRPQQESEDDEYYEDEDEELGVAVPQKAHSANTLPVHPEEELEEELDRKPAAKKKKRKANTACNETSKAQEDPRPAKKKKKKSAAVEEVVDLTEDEEADTSALGDPATPTRASDDNGTNETDQEDAEAAVVSQENHAPDDWLETDDLGEEREEEPKTTQIYKEYDFFASDDSDEEDDNRDEDFEVIEDSDDEDDNCDDDYDYVDDIYHRKPKAKPRKKKESAPKQKTTGKSNKDPPPEPKKKKKPIPKLRLRSAKERSKLLNRRNWFQEFRNFLTRVMEDSQDNVDSVMRKVKPLVRGKGISYHVWGDVVFMEGVEVKLSDDFYTLLQQAKDFEHEHGDDGSHGWQLRHPIKKLGLFQEYLLDTE